MKKIFSLLMAFVFGATLVSAKTIYCKMEHDWWKVDGAAVGCYAWGTSDPNADWPGARMTPVEGETDLWSIDLDLEKFQNVIFTRISPLGIDLADWGAKTKDLTIPTNGDNLFTITTSDESWGDPGCDGEWSVYGDTPTPPTPGTSTYYLVGYINGADYGISGDIDNMGDYNLTAGPVVITFTEKSYVQVKNQNKSIYGTAYVDATEPGSTVLSVGATDKIGLPANVEITFTLTENADGTVTLAYTWGDTPTPPTPGEEGFGIILGDGSTIKGQKNEGQVEFLEYVTEANLTAGAIFQLYDFANEVAWTEDNIDEASTPNLTINVDYVYEVAADGKYTIYLKMYGPENNQVYCGYEEPVSGLNNVKAAPSQRFNVLGLPVDANYRGIVIMNGQTYLQ